MKRVSHSGIVRTVVTLVTSACIGGTGSGLTGVAGNGNGGGTGAAPVLSFFGQPNTANAGQIMSAVRVVASDSLGRVMTGFTGAITIVLASNSTGAGLSGTKIVRAASGMATFPNLSIDRAGTYTLQASASGAAPATSNAFVITPPGTP